MRIVSLDAETRVVLKKVFLEISFLTCFAAVVLLLSIHGEPFQRGFFCDDESLMHPHHENTVGISLLTVGLGLPIALIIIIEFARNKLNVDDTRNIKLKLFNRDVPLWVLNVYINIICFLFGGFLTILATDVGKQTLGRLRPHFIAVCQPMMKDGTNCSDAINRHRYIEEYSCGNTQASPSQLKEMRLSFPSGHSSIAVYTMFFAAIYLHYRMNWNGSKLFRPFFQFMLVMLAWYTALTRISDYKHHWSDVVGGSLIGISICAFTIYGIADLHKITQPIRKPQTVLPINPHPIVIN